MPNEDPPRTEVHPSRLSDFVATRGVVELVILALTIVVAFSILATGATIAIIEIRDPTVDTSTVTETLTQTITGILGALLGLIAGKADSKSPPSS